MPRVPRTVISTLLVRSFLLLLAVTPVMAQPTKCISGKLHAVGNLESQLLTCKAKSLGKGDAGLFAPCAGKASAKYSKSFEKAGACIGVEGDCGNVATDDCLNGVLAVFSDPGPNKCEATRATAIGKFVGALLNCVAQKAPADVSECESKAIGKFQKAFDKVSGCAGDGQSGSYVSTIPTLCVAPVVTLDGGGNVVSLCTTTTTTTTTSTSTTTTTDPCLGACESEYATCSSTCVDDCEYQCEGSADPQTCFETCNSTCQENCQIALEECSQTCP